MTSNGCIRFREYGPRPRIPLEPDNKEPNVIYSERSSSGHWLCRVVKLACCSALRVIDHKNLSLLRPRDAPFRTRTAFEAALVRSFR